MSLNHAERPWEARGEGPEGDVIEFTLLLPVRQAAELERLAHSRSLTLGQLLRQLVQDSLAAQNHPLATRGGYPSGTAQGAAG
jgi:hypothetical protein